MGADGKSAARLAGAIPSCLCGEAGAERRQGFHFTAVAALVSTVFRFGENEYNHLILLLIIFQ